MNVAALIKKFYCPEGQGNITYGDEGGAASGFINVAGARNGLTVDPSSYIVLGQPVGNTGNDAKLLQDRDIPFAGNTLNLYDLLNTTQQNAVSIHGDAPIQLIEQDDGAAKFMYFQPYNYGTTYPTTHSPSGTTTMDRWLLAVIFGDNNDPGGMPDAVLNFGYNMNVSGGRAQTDDASWRLGFETNYFIGTGGIALNFEFHMPEVTLFDGTIFRTDSKYVDKGTGNCLWQNYVNNHEYYTTAIAGNPIFANLTATNGGLETHLNLYGNDASGNVPDAVITGNGTDGSFIKFIMQRGNLFIGTNTEPSSITLFSSNNIHLARSQSVTPSNWRGVLVGNDGMGTDQPDAALALDVIGTTKGFAPPRMTTTQKVAIVSPPAGCTVYDTTLNKMSFWNGAAWEVVTSV